MRVRLHTNGKNLFSEEEWSHIHSAFQFFVDEFDLDRYDLPVYVKFTKIITSKTFVDAKHNDINRGNCITHFRFQTQSGEIEVDRFVLNISHGKLDKVIDTIFHEMTHVLQALRGDIEYLPDGSEVYKGVYYSVDKLSKPTYTEYRAFPWEVEARQVGAEMTAKWHKKLGIKQTFWQKLLKFWS